MTPKVSFGTQSFLQVPDMLCQCLFGFGENLKNAWDEMSSEDARGRKCVCVRVYVRVCVCKLILRMCF